MLIFHPLTFCSDLIIMVKAFIKILLRFTRILCIILLPKPESGLIDQIFHGFRIAVNGARASFHVPCIKRYLFWWVDLLHRLEVFYFLVSFPLILSFISLNVWSFHYYFSSSWYNKRERLILNKDRYFKNKKCLWNFLYLKKKKTHSINCSCRLRNSFFFFIYLWYHVIQKLRSISLTFLAWILSVFTRTILVVFPLSLLAVLPLPPIFYSVLRWFILTMDRVVVATISSSVLLLPLLITWISRILVPWITDEIFFSTLKTLHPGIVREKIQNGEERRRFQLLFCNTSGNW